MYEWNTPNKPLPDFDGKIHVDSDRRVYQWDHHSGTWMHRNHWYLKEVGHVQQEMFGRSLGQSLTGAMNSVIINEWDMLYTKAFVHVEMTFSNTSYYVANLTLDELDNFLQAVTPKGTNGFVDYSDIVSLRVFQVVDPTVNTTRTGHSNIMYALMRGTHSYSRKKGRSAGNANPLTSAPLTPQTGFSNKMHNVRFVDDWHVDVAMKSITEFFGILNAPSDDDSNGNGNNLFYFTRARENLYHLPKTGSMITVEDRWWYNVATNSYDRINGKVTASLGTPRFFGNAELSDKRNYFSMSVLKGNSYLSDGWMGVIVYPLSAVLEDSTQVRAFLVKPYGVDCVGLGLRRELRDETVWSIFSENSYPDSFTKKHRLVTGSRMNLEFNELVTFKVNDAIKFARGSLGLTRNVRATSNVIPKKIDFFLQNRASGVRTENLGTGLQVVRHRNCMPVGVLPTYK